MKRSVLFFAFVLMTIVMMSADEFKGGHIKNQIGISQTKPPKPSIMIDDPVAEYNTVTGTLTITLDATYYSDYVITIEGDYVCMDYYVTSPVTVFPAYALSEVTYIYIDSDDCGAYEGVLDMNDLGNTY